VDFKNDSAGTAALKIINNNADINETSLRISLDAKATVKIGEFDRGGRNRVFTKANDHDFDGA
jgi:hypothetical protein